MAQANDRVAPGLYGLGVDMRTPAQAAAPAKGAVLVVCTGSKIRDRAVEGTSVAADACGASRRTTAHAQCRRSEAALCSVVTDEVGPNSGSRPDVQQKPQTLEPIIWHLWAKRHDDEFALVDD